MTIKPQGLRNDKNLIMNSVFPLMIFTIVHLKMVIYRTFGLALLAGVIDSLCAYAAVKKNEMQERKLAGLRPRGCCFCCSRGRVEASPRPKQETPVTAAHSKHTLDSYLAS